MSDTSECPRCVEQATLFVAGELGVFARARFVAHLRSCGECAAAVGELREARTALGALARSELSAAAREQLSASARRLLAEEPEQKPMVPGWRLVALGGTLATAVVAALVLRPPSPLPVTSWPGQSRPPAVATPAPDLLAWDPPGDLDRIAGAIQDLERPRFTLSPSLSTESFSSRDPALDEVRRRIERIRQRTNRLEPESL